jgi:hypothetical protein
MPNSFINIDYNIGAKNKLFNATMHDLGKGNIKLLTAWETFQRHRNKFPSHVSDWSSMVDYIRSNEGTVHIATLVIKRAEKLKEAVYITYYKQGPSYISRFKESLAQNPGRNIQPGEGCRTFYQRSQILKALGQ